MSEISSNGAYGLTHDIPAAGSAYGPGAAAGAALSDERSPDGILITLLALNLILLAFFVVLNATSSFDADRVRAVAASARTSLFSDVDVREEAEAESYRSALSNFRDSIADQFAPVLFPASDSVVRADIRIGGDRVEVDVPATVFFRSDGTLYSPLPTLDGLAAVVGTPPAGYRAELAIRATAPAANQTPMVRRVATLADDLVARGIAATALSAGLLPGADIAPGAEARVPVLRFSFLLLSTDDDASHASRLAMSTPAREGAR